ncbi:MAG: hypothetical protein HOM11_07675 [Methylococcales bacterium]|nr:hypothetical protein [Methylococcales bacterium]MBT7444571.1 hypothetical protein [Methylococcales bacterium]
MKFKLIYENHGNFGLHIGDYFLYLKYVLQSLGHTADIEHAFCPGETNIILEYFNDKFTDKVEKEWTKDTRIIVIATEFLTNGTFNNIYQEEAATRDKADQNQHKEFWQMRYNNFVKLLPKFNAIWHVADQPATAYKHYFSNTFVDYMPHCFTSDFHTVKHRPDTDKDIDVLFTGTLTKHRKEVLETLKNSGLNVVSSTLFTAPFHRDDLISRSKLVLNIKQHPNWLHESVTRLYYHITNDSLLITDQCQYPTDLNPYVITRSDSWVNTIQHTLNTGDITQRAVSLRKKMACERPPEKYFLPLLTKTLDALKA